MTDNEIIKLLECCKKSQCSKCYYSKECDGYTQVNYALDLITRQQAEIDNLKVENQSLRTAGNSLKMHYEEAQAEIKWLNAKNMLTVSEKNAFRTSFYNGLKQLKTAKAEAYKEFAEKSVERVEKAKSKYQRLCKEQGEEMEEHMHIHFNGITKIINNLLKELVGDDNA